MASAHRSGNFSPPCASRGDRDVRTTCLFCSKGKRCSVAGGHWAGIWMAAAAPSRPAGSPGQGQGQGQRPHTRLPLPAGTAPPIPSPTPSHHASTLVGNPVPPRRGASVALRFHHRQRECGASGQGRLPAGRQLSLPWIPSQCFPSCQTGVIFADSWTSQDFCCCTSLPPASFQFFEKVRPASGVGSEQGLEEHSCSGVKPVLKQDCKYLTELPTIDRS